LTTEIKSNNTFIIFVVLMIIGFLAGILLLILWQKNNQSISKLAETIRKRLPREEIPELFSDVN
jgi:CHASE3 domain sensor protein